LIFGLEKFLCSINRKAITGFYFRVHNQWNISSVVYWICLNPMGSTSNTPHPLMSIETFTTLETLISDCINNERTIRRNNITMKNLEEQVSCLTACCLQTCLDMSTLRRNPTAEIKPLMKMIPTVYSDDECYEIIGLKDVIGDIGY